MEPTSSEEKLRGNNYIWPHNVATYTCSGIAFILLICTVVVYIALLRRACEYHAKRHTRDKRDNIRPSIFRCTLIACSLLIAANIVTFSYIINSQIYDELYEGTGKIFTILSYSQIATYGAGKLLCHALFILRLYFTFKDVPYLRYSNSVFYIFGALVLFAVVIVGVFYPLSDLVAKGDTFSFTVFFSALGTIIYLCDFIGSLLILILFVKKLHQLVIRGGTQSTKDMHKVTLRHAGEQTLAVIVKLTLLSLLSAFGSLCLFVAFLLRLIIAIQGKLDEEMLWKLVYPANIFLMLSAMINVMALYLVLSFAKNHYDRYCRCPHDCLRRSCKHMFKQGIRRERKKSKELAAKEISEAQVGMGHESPTASSKTGGTKKMRLGRVPDLIMPMNTVSVMSTASGSNDDFAMPEQSPPPESPVITPAPSGQFGVNGQNGGSDDNLSVNYRPDMMSIPMTKVESGSENMGTTVDQE